MNCRVGIISNRPHHPCTREITDKVERTRALARRPRGRARETVPRALISGPPGRRGTEQCISSFGVYLDIVSLSRLPLSHLSCPTPTPDSYRFTLYHSIFKTYSTRAHAQLTTHPPLRPSSPAMGPAISAGGGPHCCISCMSAATLSGSEGCSSYATRICPMICSCYGQGWG